MGKLAIDCLNEDIENRPDMTEVAEQLVMIRRNKKAGTPDKKVGTPDSVNPDNWGHYQI
jgi:hypothetical protein